MAGRPKRQFSDEEKQQIEQYARNNCLTNTIAVALNIPLMTLKRHFGKKLKVWRALGKVELRDNLHKQSVNSPQTAIFLAKNLLGMVDKQILTTEQPVPVISDEERQALADLSRRYKLKLASKGA